MAWRTWVFFFLCIPIRLLIAASTLLIEEMLLGLIHLSVGLGFFYRWLSGAQKGIFGGKAYWASARPLHAYLWSSAALCILLGEEDLLKVASGVLFLDAFFGLFVGLLLGPYLGQ